MKLRKGLHAMVDEAKARSRTTTVEAALARHRGAGMGPEAVEPAGAPPRGQRPTRSV